VPLSRDRERRRTARLWVAIQSSDGLAHNPCVHADLPHSFKTKLFKELDRRAE
jgi:hypothetical protein